MPGDISRNSVNPPKNYVGVLMQQGRVQLDADWNEQLALQHHRTFTETGDVIGSCGTPKAGNGFRIEIAPGGGDLIVEPGRFYVHGLLCENNPQKIPVAFPAAASSFSLPTFTRFAKKVVSPPFSHVGPPIHWTDLHGQVNVPALSVDDRNLCIGDWVELSASGVNPLVARITAISADTAETDPDSITPNYYTLTIDRAVFAFQNAREAWLRRVVTFTTQPFLHSQLDASLEMRVSGTSLKTLDLPDGDYLLTLDAWIREADALEDPHMREVALGGPDTARRLQTAWQVHVVPYEAETTPSGSPSLSSPPASLDCCTDFPGWDQYKASLKTTGLMNAQAPPPTTVPPCQIPPSAGYLGLANQLYRVEIFQTGSYNNDATFVWSRDNAMVETPVVCVDSNGVVYVSDLGKDDLHSFGLNNWVEIYDRADELLGKPRFLAQITSPPGGTMTPPCAAPGAAQAYNLTLTPPATQFSGSSSLFLRRWDMPASGSVVFNSAGSAAVGIPIVPGWIQLENNIQVNFTEGHYATRSFWQIPARTATGDIEWPPYIVPNINPIPQPPLGVDHYFCRLATLTVTAGHWLLADCRCRFPSLTHICADDICFHGDGCELTAVNTVQEAIEELGARLRYHNKMLHGTGVVCGLAVTCSSGSRVTVHSGYGIDCQGYDLILKKDTSVDFSSLIELSPPQDTIPDGDYELILEKQASAIRKLASTSDTDEACCSKSAPASTAACVTFKAIPCKTETFGNEVLQGTLLLDFYNNCIRPFLDAFRERYTNSYINDTKQVTRSQALVSSFTSLVYPLAQSNGNLEVFVSPQEHEVLGEFYRWLVSRLRDRTFCSLKNDLPEFPAYNVKSTMTTIFGKGMSTRLRVDTTGQRAFAVGSDYNVYVYDLSKGELASVVPMPSPANTTGWVVKDVAFKPDASQIYAIATSSGASLFAVGTLNQDSITWSASRSLGALSFATMVWDPASQGLYAVASGQGLYTIVVAPASGNGLTQIQGLGIPAGHLVATGEFVYLTVNLNSAAGSPGTFNAVQRPPAPGGGASTAFLPQGVTGNLTDDLLASGKSFWVTATSAAGKEVYTFNYETNQPIYALPLNDNTTVRMAFSAQRNVPLISFEDGCSVQMLEFASPLLLSPLAPTEVHPNSIVVVPAGNRSGDVLALNSTSNTISVMPAAMSVFEDNSDLDKYRIAVFQAFMDVFRALLQNFKDCFCDLLLVQCPSCNDEERGDGISLGCVTFRNGSAYKICNMEKRHYVKSFPTVGYWLSLLPVIPYVRTLIERFCCLDFVSVIKKTAQPITAGFNMNLDPATTRERITQIGNFKLTDAVSSFTTTKLTPVGQFAGDAVLSPFRATAVPAAAVQANQVIGQPVATVRNTLQASNISVVAETSYDPAQFLKNAAAFTTAPASLPAGSSVTLVTDQSGNVKYYIPGTAAETQLNTGLETNKQQIANVTAAEQPVAANVAGLQTLVTSLQTQLANAQTVSAQALAQRDQQIATLTATTQQLQTKVQTIDDLAAQVKALSARLPPAKA